MALLTPKDIREHTFQTVRFKEGYDVDEVDDFLDQVTETVEALGKQAMQNGPATQPLGQDVANLNAKISELNNQIESLKKENTDLKAVAATAGNASAAEQAVKTATEQLHKAEENNRALAVQYDQFKRQSEQATVLAQKLKHENDQLIEQANGLNQQIEQAKAQGEQLKNQNDQLKSQVDRLSAQIDQLTAQAAKEAGNKDVAEQLNAVTRERDQFRANTENLSRELATARQQLAVQQQTGTQVKELQRQLEESRERENKLRAQIEKVEPSTETGSLQKIAGAAQSASSEPERATAMLTLAMQLHDQYVDKGKAKAKEITEASQAKYEELVTKANDYSSRTRSEADDYNKSTRADADAYNKQVHADADGYSVKTRQDADLYAKNKREEADNYEAEVQRRAADYDNKTRSGADNYAKQVRSELENQVKVIESNIQGLKQFETEYRTRLTDFLGQLMNQVSDSNNYSKVDQSQSSPRRR